MPEDGRRSGLFAAIDVSQERIINYIAENRPASTRLSTISIVSSSLAAVLTIAPATGGGRFAATVRDGLSLPQAEPVWRTMCFAAAMVAVVAAISANLTKSNDLPARIKLAEESGAALKSLRDDLEFGDLPASEALSSYKAIAAKVPFVGVASPHPDVSAADSGGGRRRRDWLAVFLVATIVVALLLLLVTMVGLFLGLGKEKPATPAAAPTSSAAPVSSVPAPAVYAGRTDDGGMALAVAVDNGRAAAYLCDGKKIEAWLQGTASEGKVSLTGSRGAGVTGTMNDRTMDGTVSVGGEPRPFSLAVASPPAGVYQARTTINGVAARIGWVVLPDGSQVGVSTSNRAVAPAPRLDAGRFVLDGASHPATAVSGADTVVGG
ncbi:MAG: hypothetical protein QOI21_5140 [Actinomycetota bacterium]|nr:hypothetical protein [Actinomycetota bacterium]